MSDKPYLGYYALNPDHTTSLVNDIRAFDSPRHVAVDEIGDAQISTVFLVLDHNHGGHGNGLPILFETMIFGGPHDQYQTRYHTWDEALAGHTNILANLRAGRHPDVGNDDAAETEFLRPIK